MHTKGPWQYALNVGPTKAFIVEQDGSTVLEVKTNTRDSQFTSNIRLITAVPDLLEALRSFMSRVQGLLDGETDTQYLWDKLGPEYRQAMSAIAKAEGKELT